MAGRVLIIGAGGVGTVVAHKCAQDTDTFSAICLASRTKAKCDAIAAKLPRAIETAQVDADEPKQTAELIRAFEPQVVVNVALPYQDLAIMEACLETGVPYLDTANYEPPDVAKFEYKWQWAYRERFEQAGLMALLGCGFDPGVTNVFTAHVAREHFDEITQLDILDANAGDHGQPFATNFNPEINIREITQKGRYWEAGDWREIPAMSERRVFDFPGGVGLRDIYLLYHEELESLTKHYPSLRRARFWMTFSEKYLTHLRLLENVGMTGIEPIEVAPGVSISPLQFLKKVLPDPASLGPLTTGKTCIGCLVTGLKNGEESARYIYNICDHEEAFRETGAQAISYTTGVPAALGARLMLRGEWAGAGVFNVEQLDPAPFLSQLPEYGLPWEERPFPLDLRPE